MSALDKIKELQEQYSRTERCVICHIDTKVPLDMHVDLRLYYVEGAGQLCSLCYKEVYN
jgi:hypothetical protein